MAVTPNSNSSPSNVAKALQSALDALTEAGLLFRLGEPPSASYFFKHALVQDVAYGTLLREPRRALHALASPKPWRASFRRLPTTIPKCSRAIVLRRD